MKKLVYLLFTALLVLGCNTSDDYQVKNNEIIDNPSDDTVNAPDDPNRGYNMDLLLEIDFMNNNGVNLFNEINPLFDKNAMDVDVYGVNGFINEFPFSDSNPWGSIVFFWKLPNEKVVMRISDFSQNSEVLQEKLNERKWLKYRITFPDATEYIIKVEGRAKVSYPTDYYPTKVYVNDELKWEQPEGRRSGFVNLTIVK